MKQLLLFQFLFLALIYPIESQNLIPNPGFENIRIANRTEWNYNYYYPEWNYLVPIDRKSNYGLPEFSEYLGNKDIMKLGIIYKDTIVRKSNIIKPHRGNGHLFTPNFTPRTLNEAKLLVPLEKDSLYYFQMYININSNNYKKEELINGKIGLWFCNRDFSDEKGRLIMQENKMRIKPHIQVKDYKASDFKNWVKFTASFKSDQNYSYVVLGNVEPLAKVVPEDQIKIQGISYRIDDMCLVPFYLKSTCEVSNEEEVFDIQNVYFELNSFQLNKSNRQVLQDMVQYLKNDNLTISLFGYTDSSGKEKKNAQLSENRAKSVYDFLINAGINKSKLSFAGHGSSDPVASNTTEEGRSMNRRVELKIKIDNGQVTIDNEGGR